MELSSAIAASQFSASDQVMLSESTNEPCAACRACERKNTNAARARTLATTLHTHIIEAADTTTFDEDAGSSVLAMMQSGAQREGVRV
jgi:hypothetical protein